MKTQWPPNTSLLRGAGYRVEEVIALSKPERDTLKKARAICQQAMDLRNLDRDSEEWCDCQFRSAAYAIDSIFDDGPWPVA